MKNLLFFTSDFSIGISSLLTDQLIALNKSNINVIGIGGENEQEQGLRNMIQSENIRLEIIEGLDKHDNFNLLANKIKRIIVNENIDIVHVQNNWQLALVYFVKTKLFFKKNFEIIYTIHGFRHNHPLKSKLAQVVIGSALFLGANHIICMTKYLKNKFRILSYKINLLPLGVKNDYFLDSFVSPNIDSLRLIFPAQFRRGKNQDKIIRAFAEFLNFTKDKKAVLTLPGNGPTLEEMKSLAKDLHISVQVNFPGFVSKDEIRNLYLDHNVAIVSSNSETFGQSIVEPFVLGRCVLSTPVGIAPEIIINGENGFIFKNESELTERLIDLNKNKSLLISMGRNNYELRNQFKWETITQQYKETFNL